MKIKILLSLTLSILFAENSYAYNILEINVTAVDVILESGKGKEPSITDSTNKSEEKITIDKSNGDFYITGKGLSNSVSNAGQLIIQVPKSYTIKAKGMSSNFRVVSSCGTKINIKSMSGNIRSNCLAVSETQFESMSGHIRVKSSLKSGVHLLSSMSGDVDVMLGSSSTGKVAVISEKGSVQINQEAKRSGKIIKELGKDEVALVAKTISGDASIEF